MAICEMCTAQYDTINGLAKHIHSKHNISKKEYYDTYVAKVASICVCGVEKKFRNIGEGYRQYCSPKCRSNNIAPTKYWVNRSQHQEMIDKRRNTMIDKYGVSNGYLTKHSVAEKYKGFVCRSKYEKLFVDFAERYEYTLVVPDRIEYSYEGKSRHYYPDFYIKELDLIVEVKSDWTWHQNLDLNLAKMVCTIEQGYSIVFIDEEHGVNTPERWDELNEYLCSVNGSD